MQKYNRGYILENGQKIYYDYGKFDNWCVYVEQNGKRHTPTDNQYFKRLYDLGSKYGFEQVYNSFCSVYDAVVKCGWNLVNRANCSAVCKKVALLYEEDTLSLWITLYMTMLAEEMKKNAILGKRIKRLAVYYILMQHKDIKTVTSSMRGKRWFELDAEMQKYGI